MNILQKSALILYVIIIFLMIIYLPYNFFYKGENMGAGNYFIWQQPEMKFCWATISGTINFSLLLVQFIGASLIIVAVVSVLKSKSK